MNIPEDDLCLRGSTCRRIRTGVKACFDVLAYAGTVFIGSGTFFIGTVVGTVIATEGAEAAIPGLAPQKAWDLSGYVHYLLTASAPAGQSHRTDHQLHQRLNAEYRLNQDIHFNAGLRQRLLWGDTAKMPGYAEQIDHDNGYFDLSSNWHDKHGSTGNSQLDRLYVTWNLHHWQMKGGRQRINWGMATIWNPNDLFNAYSLYDLDYVERPGTDALLVSYNTGYASGASLVFNSNRNNELNKNSQQNSYAGRYFFNTQGWDVQLLGGRSGTDHVLGLGFAGDIKGAGFRGELSYFHPDQHQWQGKNTEPATVATLEADYSFAGEHHWSVKVAWLYLGQPAESISPELFLTQPFSARTLSFSRNSYYGEAGFDWSALLRLTVSGIYYQDSSCYLNFSGQYSLANDWQLTSGLQYFGGAGNSVYGQAENTLVYLLVGWSF